MCMFSRRHDELNSASALPWLEGQILPDQLLHSYQSIHSHFAPAPQYDHGSGVGSAVLSGPPLPPSQSAGTDGLMYLYTNNQCVAKLIIISVNP
jgi:hypothetical protein